MEFTDEEKAAQTARLTAALRRAVAKGFRKPSREEQDAIDALVREKPDATTEELRAVTARFDPPDEDIAL